tara:strand:- start:12569 stop:14167 length:1599 start_codon:yes stop_codon:yes gene_type:complete
MGWTDSRFFIVVPEGMTNTSDERVVITSDMASARLSCDHAQGDLILDLSDNLPINLLRHVGHAMVLIDEGGLVQWGDQRFQDFPDSIRESITQGLQQDASQSTIQDGAVTVEGRSFYRLTARPESASQALVVLIEITWMQQQRDRRAALRSAGLAIRDLDRKIVSDLTVADRLRMLEGRIINCIHEELSFDNFEIRLLDQTTQKLELVIAKNLTPLKIGEVIHRGEEGNGISGWVAATGNAYICPDVASDPRYREGLDDAASSLTVPLKMQDQVIGVLNVESLSANAFDQDDLELAEILAHYIADAMHMLDLLVVERFTTREQATRSVLSELDAPFDELNEISKALRGINSDEPAFQEIVDRLVNAASSMKSRVEACMSGPRSILDAEHELQRLQIDEQLSGLHVLVTDDEPRIREEMFRILSQVGCRVTLCENGRDAIDALRQLDRGEGTLDLVVTDIKLPDLTGYEVFSGARSSFPEVPVILMTGFGYDPSHSIVRASQEGVSAVLFKPFRTGQLLDAIKSALQFTISED